MSSFKEGLSNRPATLEVGSLLETINAIKRRDLSMSKDDAHIDYISVLDQDDLVRRFSEDIVDLDTRNSLQLRKLYRQIQRQVHCMENDQVHSPQPEYMYVAWSFSAYCECSLDHSKRSLRGI